MAVQSKAMASKFDPKFVEEMDGILNQIGKGVNSIFQEAMELMKAWKICYTQGKVNCKHFFVHRRNRGGYDRQCRRQPEGNHRISSLGPTAGAK